MSHELSNDADDALARLLDPSGDEEGGLGLGTSQRRGHACALDIAIETSLSPPGPPRRGLHRAKQDSITWKINSIHDEQVPCPFVSSILVSGGRDLHQ
jgi:hypothetical protein